jgi:hypothetical protein
MTTTIKDDLKQECEFPEQKPKTKRRVITDDDAQMPPTR